MRIKTYKKNGREKFFLFLIKLNSAHAAVNNNHAFDSWALGPQSPSLLEKDEIVGDVRRRVKSWL